VAIGGLNQMIHMAIDMLDTTVELAWHIIERFQPQP